jgi:hypothetical protein
MQAAIVLAVAALHERALQAVAPLAWRNRCHVPSVPDSPWGSVDNRIMTTVALERACEHCGRSFTPKRSDARFHTDACRTAAGRSKRTEPNRTPAMAKTRAPVTAIRAEPLTWNPPSEPRRVQSTDEPCPDCGDMLAATARGTWRACLTCRRAVVPTAVAAPYGRGRGALERQVTTQRERDLDAIALARRKGVMLGQLSQLATDDRLHSESVPVVEWFAGEVKAAKSGGRLDELGQLLPESGIRRRHWWQGEPAALPVGYDDLDDDDELDDDDGEPAVSPPQLTIAPASGPGGLTWAGALAAQGWRLSPIVGGCQIIGHGGLCGQTTTQRIAGGWVCPQCYAALCAVITGSSA